MGHDLWDESALINAFENTLSNYKVMHNQGGNILSNDDEEVVNRGDEILPTPDYQSHEARSSEKEGENLAAPNINFGVGLPNENNQLESDDPDKTGSSMNGQNIQSDQTGILDTQSLEDYNQLLSRYYEIEDQRQKVLQQLSQFGYWDYQDSVDSGWSDHTVPPAMSPSQEHQAYATQGYCSNVESTCSPYGCQLVEAPSSSFSSPGLDAESNDNIGNPTSRFDGHALEPEMKLNLTGASDLNAVTNA
ncbi:hypothetical protein Leryth_010530 [Lithospermum erythrorhizon]|nr:hypothetical protein Leryth_010530 [Lithospermum erythrorhizon]